MGYCIGYRSPRLCLARGSGPDVELRAALEADESGTLNAKPSGKCPSSEGHGHHLCEMPSFPCRAKLVAKECSPSPKYPLSKEYLGFL